MVTEKTYAIKQNGKTILSITITQPEGMTYTNIQWDSKTGLVTANVNGEENRKAIPFTGISYGAIQPNSFEAENIWKMDYHYWYY